MVLTLVLALVTFVALILSIIVFPKIKLGKLNISTFWVVALIGAILMLATLRVSFKEVGESLFSSSSAINPIKLLALFFSMTFISIVLEEAGLFKFLATYCVKKAKTSQLVLFIILYFLTALLTIVTSNDIVILTFTPFICYFCKHAKINPIPYLIAEFAAANTWSMMLVIGNPTNVCLATNAGINFIEYTKVMLLPTLAAGVAEFAIILLLSRKSLKAPIETETEVIPVNSKVDVIVGLVHLAICIILLSLSTLINVEMYLICVCAAGSLLIYFIVTRIIRKNLKISGILIGKRLPWTLIPFIISMFIIVIALQKQGVTNEFAKFLGSTNTIWTYGPSSFVMANIINNIPMSILYSTLPNFNGTQYYGAIYSSVVGSNIGAFVTPIGALAGIMFTGILKENDVKLSFKQFSMYGVIIAIPTLAICLGILSLVL